MSRHLLKSDEWQMLVLRLAIKHVMWIFLFLAATPISSVRTAALTNSRLQIPFFRRMWECYDFQNQMRLTATHGK